MRRLLVILLTCLSVLPAFGQAVVSKYQPGTITAVKAHETQGQPETGITQYDVSVRVGNTSYGVLYTPPAGSNTVQFAAGIEILVLVGNQTLTFNDAVSGKTEVPILTRTSLPAQALDQTRVCGQYFSVKLQRMTDLLVLTDKQQSEIKPILEQETGEVDEICFNPVLSQNDTLNQYEKIVRTSDQKIKPFLSAAQLQKLQDLRKQQKEEIKRTIAQWKSSKPS